MYISFVFVTTHVIFQKVGYHSKLLVSVRRCFRSDRYFRDSLRTVRGVNFEGSVMFATLIMVISLQKLKVLY